MKNLKSILISKTCVNKTIFVLAGILWLFFLFHAPRSQAKIYIDINAPSIPLIKIAVPKFKNLSAKGEQPELAKAFADICANDLDLSGYFEPMEETAFLEEDDQAFTIGSILFKNWAAINAELLVKAAYTCIGQNIEIEFRLYDVFQAREVTAKRFFGRVEDYRTLAHRVSDAIVFEVTGFESIFLTKLVFVDNSTGFKEIYTSDFDGHNVKQITADKSIALFPRWSPQGDKLSFNSFKSGQLQLYVRDMAIGTVRRVSLQEGMNLGGRWTPDGRYLALTLAHEGDADLYLLDLEGKIQKRLTNQSGIDVSAAFSPDGAKMAFISGRSGSPQLYVKDLSDNTERRISYFPEGEGKYNTSPHWSSRDQIVFSSSNKRHDIYMTDPKGETIQRLTGLTGDQGDNEEPCWSPDGRYIIFSSNREGRYHLYLMNINNTNRQRKITTLKGSQTSPSWIRP